MFKYTKWLMVMCGLVCDGSPWLQQFSKEVLDSSFVSENSKLLVICLQRT